MRKVLYTTTALAAASLLVFSAGDAMAQSKAKKMKIGVGGFFQAQVGASSQDSSFESTGNSTSRAGFGTVNTVNNSEIIFSGSTKLDSGITVSVRLELEGEQETANRDHTNALGDGDAIDESYLKLTGGFGDLRLGSTKSVVTTMGTTAPWSGVFPHFTPDTNSYIVVPAGMFAGGLNGPSSPGTTSGGGDFMRINYFTPKMAGFQAAVGFMPSSDNVDTPPVTGGNAGDDAVQYDAALAYKDKVGGASIDADVGYIRVIDQDVPATTANSYKAWRAGVKIGIGGFQVGGSYRKVSDTDNSTDGAAGSKDEKTYDVGIRYGVGPYSVAATYLNSKRSLSSAVAGDDEVKKIVLGGTYSMGPGVTLQGTVANVKWDDETNADAANNEGWAVIGGIRVSF